MSEPGDAEPNDSSTASAEAAASQPATSTDAPATAATGFAATAQRLHAEGKSRSDILAELSAQGLDEESARILLNTLPGAPERHDLPEANLDMGKNPLAPSMFTLSHLGLSGPPRMVGIYWIAFGAVAFVLLGLLLITAEVNPWATPSRLALVFARIGLGLGLLAVIRGLWRVILRR